MTEQLEDRSFKRLTDTFPVPMLKYLHVNHDRAKPCKTTLEISKNNKQFLDYVLEISENKVIDLEFHSTVLTLDHLGRYGTYKIYLRIDSKKLVYQCILCTADKKKKKKQLCINENEELKIINNNRKLTNTDIEIMYLTVALFMNSELSKSELLLKIATLTNQVKGLSDEEIYEIKVFQKAFMKKFISDDDELKKEIEKMISIPDMEAMKQIFPKESEQLSKEKEKIGMKKGKMEEKIKTALNMKNEQMTTEMISKITGLNPEEIEKL